MPRHGRAIRAAIRGARMRRHDKARAKLGYVKDDAVLDDEGEALRVLWTFEDQAKLDKFTAVLTNHEMAFEINAKSADRSTNLLTLSVDDSDYEKAKRLLMRHRKRKTSS